MGAGTGCLPGPGWEENFWECQRVSLYTNQAFPAQMNMLRKPNTWRSNTIIKEIRKDQNSGLETETKTLSEHCCSQSHDCVRLLKGYSSKLFTIYSITKFKTAEIQLLVKTVLKIPVCPVRVPLLTTEMLRVRRLANSVTSQVTLPPPHRASVDEMPSVPVASFTFCRPLAQAEEHTSQRKTRLAVIRKSWKPV